MVVRIIFLAFNAVLFAFGSFTLVRQWRGTWRHVLIGLSVLGMTTGVSLMVLAGQYYPVLTDDPAGTILFALPWATGVAILCSFLSIPMQRLASPFGTINPWLPPAILTQVLCTALMIGAGWHRYANGWLDTSADTQKTALIEQVHDETVLVRWADNTVQLLAIKAMTAQPTGTHIEISIRQGHYGLEWAAAWKPIKK